jgi:hypothetical protein
MNVGAVSDCPSEPRAMGWWNEALIWLGARKAAEMTTAAAVRAVLAGTMTAAEGAAACGLSETAFAAQLAAERYILRQAAIRLAQGAARRGAFIKITGAGLARILIGGLVLGALLTAGLYVYHNWDRFSPTRERRIACPPNTQPSGSRCIPVTRTRCPTGSTPVNGRCEPINTSDCPVGFRRCGDRCIGWRMTCIP